VTLFNHLYVEEMEAAWDAFEDLNSSSDDEDVLPHTPAETIPLEEL